MPTRLNRAGLFTLSVGIVQAFLRSAAEVLLLGLIGLTPWFYAGNDEQVLWIVGCGIVVLVLCWVGRSLLLNQFEFKLDAISFGLAAMILWTGLQLVPLPQAMVGLISSNRLSYHETFLPKQTETITPGESGIPRSSWITLSIYPRATRQVLTQLLGLWLVYLVARSLVADRESFRRLAWVMTINGVLLALFSMGHALSASPGMIYWSEAVPGAAVFGPFVCRNHYPDYVALCGGLAFGLMITRRESPQDGPEGIKPRQIGLACALGLMLISVVFSLSRGGVFSVLAASVLGWLLTRVGRETRPDEGLSNSVKYPLVIMIAVALIIASWIGTSAIESRIRNSNSSELFGSRFGIWKQSLQLLPGSWLTGTGAGTYTWTEPLTRQDGNPDMLTERAHNEYLEGWLEGGLPQLVLIGFVIGAMLIQIARGYLERRGRSVGPLILGVWGGLLVGVIHNSFDFAIRMPAVALATITLAAYGMAAARDPEFIPTRVRVRKVRSENATLTEIVGRETHDPVPPGNSWQLSGVIIWPVALLLLLTAVLVAWSLRLDWVARKYRAQAETSLLSDHPDRFSIRSQYYQARSRVLPDDAEAQADAGQALLDEAAFRSWTASGSLAGGAAAYLAPPPRILEPFRETHLQPALRYLQTARRLNPLLPLPHGRLALLVGWFDTQEPWRGLFERYQKLAPLEPDAWYYAGREAYRRGEFDTAWADWKQSLQLSTRHLPRIVLLAEERLGPVELRERLLPPDPVAVWRVMEKLYPQPNDPHRLDLLKVIIGFQNLPDLTGEQTFILALAYSELDQPSQAIEAWEQAVRLLPDQLEVRDRYARWLEQDERYREAIFQLETLLQNDRNNQNWLDRLEAARHGLDLEKRIQRK